MSLSVSSAPSSIETCRLNGINPLDYLSALMENRSAVFADPAAWFPWNYLETLHATEQPVPLPTVQQERASIIGPAKTKRNRALIENKRCKTNDLPEQSRGRFVQWTEL